MSLPPHLPDDVWRHIRSLARRDRACERIQRCARRRALRHARTAEWPALRRTLLRHLSTDDVRSLGENAMVRREWTLEPASWLASSADDLRAIVREVRGGAWESSKSHVHLT